MTTITERYNKFKKGRLESIAKTFEPYVPAILTVTSIVAVGTAIKTVCSLQDTLDDNKALLDHIEYTLTQAMEAPTIVKVELGDDIELIGFGNRTD